MKALITGAAGQDGFFLSKYLKRFGVQTIGVVRSGPDKAADNKRFRYYDDLLHCDLSETVELISIVKSTKPDLIFNFGAMADSNTQFSDPEKLIAVNLSSVAAVLDCIKANGLVTKFIQASSSEIFSGGEISPQYINTLRHPRTIYGVTKVAADELVKVYREQFNLNCYSVFLYSHESPLRKEVFFTKKIIKQLLDVSVGKEKTATIYSPEAIRDWGYAGEYCQIIVHRALTGWCGDYLLGSGTANTVRQFTKIACEYLDLNYDRVVIEKGDLNGRAKESIPVYMGSENAETSQLPLRQYNLDKLIKLLIRYEKYARNN